MKLLLIFTGRTIGRLYQEAIADYAARLGHYVSFSIEELPDLRAARALSEEQQREREANQALRLVQPGDALILLDEHGQEFTSRGFADFLATKMRQSPRRLLFLVGGPYGFAPSVHAAAAAEVSLSRMTFSHQMVRLFLVEQLYRACTILRGEPYHHD